MTFCLTPIPVADLTKLVGTNFITQFQKEIDPVIQPLRKHIALGRPASMGKELWEYAVADSITGGKWCGAGKGIADVSIGTNIGIDVKSVQTLKTATTEASMYQPLSETELSSEYFKNKDKQQIWNLYVSGYVGDGVAFSYVAAKEVAENIVGEGHDARPLPIVNHISPRWEPEPFRYVGINSILQLTERADETERRTGRKNRLVDWVLGKLIP